MALNDPNGTAFPASTYSVAIKKCSLPRLWLQPTRGLRTRLRRAVDARGVGDVAADDDRRGQAPALVVAGTGAVPVVARAVQLEGGGALGVVHQPDELGVAVARQDRAVRVLVVIDERELERAPVGQHQDPRLVDELVFGDADGGAHDSVVALLGVADGSAPENPSKRQPVLLVQPCYSSLTHEPSR